MDTSFVVVNQKIKRYKRFMIVALLVALVVSVLLNIVLFKQLLGYYKLLYAGELDPLGLSYFQDQGAEISDDLPKVVFFGDSRAAQWSAPTAAGFTFINRGIGNQTSSQVASRFAAHVSPLDPQIIILQVGINDLKTIPLFPERKQEIIETTEANIQKIVQDSLDADAAVILTTIFPASGNVPLARRLIWSNDVYLAIDEVNLFIQSLENEKVIIFDTASLLSNAEGKTKPEYSFDLFHINQFGYETLNIELLKLLERLK